MKRLGALAPAALLVCAACFATSSDVQAVNSTLEQVRADQARNDSAQRAMLAQITKSLTAARDSLAQLSARVTKSQGDMRGDLYAIQQQLIQVQELTGQSQRRLQELRGSLDQRSTESAKPPAPVPPTAGAGGGAGAAAAGAAGAAAAGAGAAGGTPGPNALFQLSLEQLRRGSASTARTGFQTLLQQYPTADVVPDAQFYVGEAFAAEGNAAGADSVYALVVERYPQSARAPTALFKRGSAMESKGNDTAARAAYNQLIQAYPRSDEAALAKERLRNMK